MYVRLCIDYVLDLQVDSDGVMSKWVYALARITPTAEGLTDVIRFRVT